jgi:DNA helicase-2/ATP-dependent DNA helicase PcrA
MEEKCFNAEQRRVIEATGGHHLVLAPPGCGKTAVLAERIAWAHEQGMPFSEMACLTFTNRAARGMRERVLSRYEGTMMMDELFIGNVHRFCLHFLFDNGLVPQHAAVIDTDTSISIIADYMGEDELQVLDDNKSRLRYSQIINLQHLMRQLREGHPNDIAIHADAVNAKAMNELCRAFSLPYQRKGVIQLYQQSADYREENTLLSSEARLLLQHLYAAHQYEQYKAQNDLLDFEDLLLDTYDVLTRYKDAEVRKYKWLQIDEVQDLNPLQLAIIDSFTAPDATVVYLGDAQQAIFSFMGAKTDTLTLLRQRCGDDHFYNFYQNYRSPQYLLDIFNSYAQRQLGIDAALLPTTQNQTPRQPGDVLLMEAQTNIDEANMVAREVKRLYEQHPEETIAVVVAFNSDADEVSNALGKLPHFKISGTDFFSTLPMRLLLAHLGVNHMEHDFISWSHIFTGLNIYASNSAARQAVRAMMQLAITPADLLQYEDTTYVTEFVKTYEQLDIVVFDTETTGLSVFEDDVVQIAAIRVQQGKVIDELNIFIETAREIPPMLGDIVNPLVEEYRQQPHLSHQEALERFVTFAQGCAILGHNATYDYQIMEHNMRRYAPHLSMYDLWPNYLDTLKLSRLLHPRQKSYKLRDLLVQLNLEGTNSHLANDDIMATLSLATHCYECGRSISGRQLEFLSRHRRMAQRFRMLYYELYQHTQEQLYKLPSTGEALASEVQYTYDYLLKNNFIPSLPKLQYMLRYIEAELTPPLIGKGREGDGNQEGGYVSLAEQLSRHYSDLCTLKEADLCGSTSMTERVFVSTVHKAKGLEFDSVIVYDAIDGKYPSAYASREDISGEEARKFYVAISRARRRLIISYCHNTVTRWGSWYAKVLTPYMNAISGCFQ